MINAEPSVSLLKINKILHEPVRLAIMLVLDELEDAEFTFIERKLDVTRGNLSSHALKLKEAGYIEVTKSFKKNAPVTIYRMSRHGVESLRLYRLTILNALERG